MELEKFLVGERGAEVGIALAHDGQGVLAELGRQAAVAGQAAKPVGQTLGAGTLVGATEPADLTFAEAEQLAGLRLREAASQDAANDSNAVDVSGLMVTRSISIRWAS